MHISLVTPAAAGSLSGNRATANRWARLLRALGHRVEITVDYDGRPADLMIALHAWRSAAAITRFAESHPGRPVVVVLTGTDAYHFILSDPETTLRSIALADRIVGLHGLIADVLPASYRSRVRVIYQSARPLALRRPPKRLFRVCLAGHLRDEKDPLRTALAARRLPPSSHLRVDAYGKAHSSDWAAAAEAEASENPRFRWHGEVSHARLREAFTRSHLLALTSRMEGGANVISEALMAGLPVVSSAIAGSIGLLGEDYPGYYPVEDTAALARLLLRAETDPAFYRTLQAACAARRPLFTELSEKRRWAALLDELG